MKRIISSFKVLFFIIPFVAHTQQGGQGNTTIFNGAQMTFFGDYSFVSGGGGMQPGIIGTVRDPTPYGILNFASTANNHTGANDANHVDGYVRKLGASSFIFPVGDNGSYGPFAASGDGTTGAYYHVNPNSAVTSNLGGGNYPVLPAGGPFPTANMGGGVTSVSTIEYWDIDGTNATPLTLTWDAGSNISALTSGSLSLLTILGWDGTNWVAIPSVVDGTSVLGGTSDLTTGSITTTASITPDTYSAYTFGTRSFPLPVTWLDVQAIPVDNRFIRIDWGTAMEINNVSFDVERSENQRDYHSIASIAGNGNMSVETWYSVNDEQVSSGTRYHYRIRQTDIDGHFTYSKIIAAQLKAEGIKIRLMPNPADRVLWAEIIADKQQRLKAMLTDMSGRILNNQVLTAQAGRNVFTPDISGYSDGTYLIRIISADGSVITEKFMIQKK